TKTRSVGVSATASSRRKRRRSSTCSVLVGKVTFLFFHACRSGANDLFCSPIVRRSRKQNLSRNCANNARGPRKILVVTDGINGACSFAQFAAKTFAKIEETR